jgi:hypothetical protein
LAISLSYITLVQLLPHCCSTVSSPSLLSFGSAGSGMECPLPPRAERRRLVSATNKAEAAAEAAAGAAAEAAAVSFHHRVEIPNEC